MKQKYQIVILFLICLSIFLSVFNFFELQKVKKKEYCYNYMQMVMLEDIRNSITQNTSISILFPRENLEACYEIYDYSMYNIRGINI